MGARIRMIIADACPHVLYANLAGSRLDLPRSLQRQLEIRGIPRAICIKLREIFTEELNA